MKDFIILNHACTFRYIGDKEVRSHKKINNHEKKHFAGF